MNGQDREVRMTISWLLASDLRKNLLIHSLVVMTLLLPASALRAQSLLESQEWKSYFDNRVYEKHADKLGKENFWDFDSNYTYYIGYPLFIVYLDGSSELIQWQYDGLDKLFRKKYTLLNDNLDRIEKSSIAYMVFDDMLLKNTMPENIINGGFNIMHTKGPLSVLKEFYVPENSREDLQTFWAVYLFDEKIDNLYLGSFTKKISKIVRDCPDLSGKIKDRMPGYTNMDDLPNIAKEYNKWVKQNYPYRYADHTAMFWQTPAYLSQD